MFLWKLFIHLFCLFKKINRISHIHMSPWLFRWEPLSLHFMLTKDSEEGPFLQTYFNLLQYKDDVPWTYQRRHGHINFSCSRFFLLLNMNGVEHSDVLITWMIMGDLHNSHNFVNSLILSFQLRWYFIFICLFSYAWQLTMSVCYNSLLQFII